MGDCYSVPSVTNAFESASVTTEEYVKQSDSLDIRMHSAPSDLFVKFEKKTSDATTACDSSVASTFSRSHSDASTDDLLTEEEIIQISRHSCAYDSTLSIMVFWKVFDYFAFLTSVIEFQKLTKAEQHVKYYGFAMMGDQAVCKEGYASAAAFLAHMENVQGSWRAARLAAEVVKIEVHGPAAEVERLRGPLAEFQTSFWSYLDGAFFVPSKYVALASRIDDRTLSVMVYWTIHDRDAFLKGVADFQALTKEEDDIKYYGFAMENAHAVCKEGYDSAAGFIAHMKNVKGPWGAAIAAADVAHIDVHGPMDEVDQLREPLKDFSVNFWGCAEGAFFAPSAYVPSIPSAPAVNSKRRCFLKDTLLKTLSCHLVPVQCLELHAQVLSSAGNPLRVMMITVHPEEDQPVVELRAGDASLTVTGSHRVMVQRGGMQATTYADDLQVGDHVSCVGSTRELEVVNKHTMKTEIVEIVFDPDDAVEAFLLPPNTILTKGQSMDQFQSHTTSVATSSTRASSVENLQLLDPPAPAPKKKIRRGGMNRRLRAKAEKCETRSIPDTYNPYEDDY